MQPTCEVHHLGLIEYQQAWGLQRVMAAEIAQGMRKPSLLLLEHPHTYTFGRRGSAKNLLWDAHRLQQRQAAIHWVDRGGDVTYHGPGQLVGYPLIPLATGGLKPQDRRAGDRVGTPAIPSVDYIGYVRKLEETLILSLDMLGLKCIQRAGLTGVWVAGQSQPQARSAASQAAKIAAIGIKVDVHGITRHGFALNIQPDMDYWKGIVPCGLSAEPVTCLADWLEPVPGMITVKQTVIAAFGAVFGYEMVNSQDTALWGNQNYPKGIEQTEVKSFH